MKGRKPKPIGNELSSLGLQLDSKPLFYLESSGWFKNSTLIYLSLSFSMRSDSLWFWFTQVDQLFTYMMQNWNAAVVVHFEIFFFSTLCKTSHSISSCKPFYSTDSQSSELSVNCKCSELTVNESLPCPELSSLLTTGGFISQTLTLFRNRLLEPLSTRFTRAICLRPTFVVV